MSFYDTGAGRLAVVAAPLSEVERAANLAGLRVKLSAARRSGTVAPTPTANAPTPTGGQRETLGLWRKALARGGQRAATDAGLPDQPAPTASTPRVDKVAAWKRALRRAPE